MSVFVNRHGDGRVTLAGGKPGWAVTWLGQDWLAGGQVARGRGLVGLEQRTGISLIGDLVTLWA